ncbi:MAG: hypothetical protein IH944_08300 [Armatimonadetes bacterium]|nr:hypothetical protein [Armatimonadota bacterium]
MGLKSWARASISAAAVCFAALAVAQSFGRFGYSSIPQVPGFRLFQEGFRAQNPSSGLIRFASPWSGTPVEVSERRATYVGERREGSPQKIRVDLRRPGFELYFPLGFRFTVSSPQSPYLTWPEGSAGADVPIPASKWFMLSFRTRQPPVLFVFDEFPVGVRITGQSGQWTIESTEHFEGWIRVCLPLGARETELLTAAQLGQAVKAIERDESFWTQKNPSLLDFRIRSDEDGVTAVWTFDRPGAVVPAAALLSRAGGYPIQILSGIRETSAELWDGVIAYTTEPKLAITFPMRRVPTGRALTIAAKDPLVIEGDDISALVELALSNLVASSRAGLAKDIDERLNRYRDAAVYTREANTGQRHPFAADGTGFDDFAARVLLWQSQLHARGEPSGENEWLRSASSRIDWSTWMPWMSDQVVSRRAAALLAIAGALCQEPERRLMGAMLQAGLCSQRGLRLYRQRRGYPALPFDLVEPMYSFRSGLYLMGPNAFVRSLASEVRVISDVPIRAVQEDGRISIRWLPSSLQQHNVRFLIGRPVTAQPMDNLLTLLATESLGELTLTYRAATLSECSATLLSPGWVTPLPAAQSVPRYSESR